MVFYDGRRSSEISKEPIVQLKSEPKSLHLAVTLNMKEFLPEISNFYCNLMQFFKTTQQF